MIDVILIWSFPDGSPAFVQARNVIVWASFVVEYVARLVLSVGKAMFVRTHKLDQLMVLLPMLRFLRIFLLLRRSLAFCEHGEDRWVDCEHRDRGRLCERVFKWRVEHDAPAQP
ncbi:MAG TPA: hypothetical protein VNT24_05850 [Propionibacteriaceae bacterium]|nr:hypothetical protein [Propionibacteriaceae bacterium]